MLPRAVTSLATANRITSRFFACERCRECLVYFSSRRRHTRSDRDWSSDVCSSDLAALPQVVVSKPLVQDIDTRLGFLGQFAAVSQVELRAQVGGTLTGIFFKDGDIVRKRSEERRVGEECRSRWSPYH